MKDGNPKLKVVAAASHAAPTDLVKSTVPHMKSHWLLNSGYSKHSAQQNGYDPCN
jgi:hypothetical protein